MTQQPDQEPTPQPAAIWKRIAVCLLASLVVVALLARLGVEAPRPLKAYGLYALGFGLATGWLVSKTAELTQLSVPGGLASRSVLLIACLAALAGQVETAWLTHRFYTRELTRLYSQDPGALLTREIAKTSPQSLGGASSAGRQLEAELEATRQERRELLARESQFGSFLRHRYGWLKLDDPWPVVVWILEVLAGCGVAVWTVRAARPQPPLITQSGIH